MEKEFPDMPGPRRPSIRAPSIWRCRS